MERVYDLISTKVFVLLKKSRFFFEAVRFQETIFALPFAYTGMMLAAQGLPTLWQVLWITVAMVGGRTLGMSANRIIDRHIDYLNPRTANRHLPIGALSLRDMVPLTIVSFLVLVIAAGQLNTLSLVLSPFAAVYMVFYPYTKRFTWLGSLALGGALAIAPMGAWIGVTGTLEWAALLLPGAVFFWATSFDILYHVQDRDFYVKNGLHSIAQKLGTHLAFRCAQVFDFLFVISLIVLGLNNGLAYPFFVGCLLILGLLIYKYRIVSENDISRLDVAFYKVNSWVSMVVLVSVSFTVLIY